MGQSVNITFSLDRVMVIVQFSKMASIDYTGYL